MRYTIFLFLKTAPAFRRSELRVHNNCHRLTVERVPCSFSSRTRKIFTEIIQKDVCYFKIFFPVYVKDCYQFCLLLAIMNLDRIFQWTYTDWLETDHVNEIKWFCHDNWSIYWISVEGCNDQCHASFEVSIIQQGILHNGYFYTDTVHDLRKQWWNPA